MAENSRAHNLASAADQYGKEALRHLNLIRAFGQEIVSGFSAFLGVHHLDVRGVPSQGGWDPDVADYRDAKFSFFERGIISIEPIDMGLAVRVRHIQDDGYFWARIVLTLDVDGADIMAWVDEAATVRVPHTHQTAELEPVFQSIYDSLLKNFTDPVERLRSLASGRIGFQVGSERHHGTRA